MPGASAHIRLCNALSMSTHIDQRPRHPAVITLTPGTTTVTADNIIDHRKRAIFGHGCRRVMAVGTKVYVNVSGHGRHVGRFTRRRLCPQQPYPDRFRSEHPANVTVGNVVPRPCPDGIHAVQHQLLWRRHQHQSGKRARRRRFAWGVSEELSRQYRRSILAPPVYSLLVV